MQSQNCAVWNKADTIPGGNPPGPAITSRALGCQFWATNSTWQGAARIYTLKELPQPQVLLTLGLLNLKPAPSRLSM